MSVDEVSWDEGDQVVAGGDDADDGFDDTGRGFDTMLFDGDQGTLTLVARRALVAVIKHSYISSDQDPKTWAVLMSHRTDIESRLNDMFLMLIVDPRAGIAYKQQAPGDRFTTLLPPDVSWALDDTILLRHLREIYSMESGFGGDAVFVDRETLIDRVVADAPKTVTDLSLARQRAGKAFENVRSARILLRTSDPERWQISPVIVPLLPLEKLQELQRWLVSSSQPGGDENSGDQDDAS